MKRRSVLAWIAACLAAPRVAAQARTRRVHVLFTAPPDDSEPIRGALLKGLQEFGWDPGRNLLVESHYAQGREDLTAGALVRAAPDVIVAVGPAAAVAIKNVGPTIPVVFVVVFEPIGLGLAKSLARPGGSFTGISTAVPETFFSKQLDLLKEAAPRLTRLAVLINPRNPMHAGSRDRRLKGVSENGLEAVEVQASVREELEPAFREAVRRRAGAMLVGGDPLTTSNAELIAELALRHGLPTMFLFSKNVVAGGLMSYGANTLDLSRRGAGHVNRILKGAKPADLPIEQPTKFDLVINLRTAKALGLAIPQSLLLRADEVIE